VKVTNRLLFSAAVKTSAANPPPHPPSLCYPLSWRTQRQLYLYLMGEEGVVYTKSYWATFIIILTGLLQSLFYKKLKSNNWIPKKWLRGQKVGNMS
jgi:hypothetical protein